MYRGSSDLSSVMFPPQEWLSMPKADAQRWNARYQQERYRSYESPRPLLVEYASFLPAHGLALDAAMGLGGNAGFLLERGLHVVGVDISQVAVQHAKARFPELMAVVADLTQFFLPSRTFDVILNFYYLQRDLWPHYQRALRLGGLLVMETLTREMLSLQPEIDPLYLLAPGELPRAFTDLELLVYREGWEKSPTGHPRAVASLIARLPG